MSVFRRCVFLGLAAVVPIVVGVAVARAQPSDPVGLWSLAGTVKVTACAKGRCQTRANTVHDFLAVDADGTFAFGLVTNDTCPDAPPIRGPWRSKAGGRTVLRGTNVRDWWAALNACSGSGVAVHGRRFSGTLVPAQQTLRVLQPATSTVRGIVVTLRIAGRFTATPVPDSASGAFVADESMRAPAGLAPLLRSLVDDVSS